MTNQQLIAIHRPSVLNYLANRLGDDKELAESVTQEVFAKMRSKAGAFDPTCNYKAWIYSIADNLGKRARKNPGIAAGVCA